MSEDTEDRVRDNFRNVKEVKALVEAGLETYEEGRRVFDLLSSLRIVAANVRRNTPEGAEFVHAAAVLLLATRVEALEETIRKTGFRVVESLDAMNDQLGAIESKLEASLLVK